MPNNRLIIDILNDYDNIESIIDPVYLKQDDPKKNVNIPDEEENLYTDTDTIDDGFINKNNVEFFNMVNKELDRTKNLFLDYAKELSPLVEKVSILDLTKRSVITSRVNTYTARELWGLYRNNGNNLPSNFVKHMFNSTDLVKENRKKIVELSNKYFNEILSHGYDVKRNSYKLLININGMEYEKNF